MRTISLKNSLLILAIVSTFAGTFFFKLSIERAAKKAREIERIESHSYERTNCEQYALVAFREGWFPCYNCGTADSIYLYKGEVWKYGKTCNGEQGRYPSGYNVPNLQYIREFVGTEKECLIMEKQKIYNYPNLPESLKRNIALIRPAGNKIDR